MQIVIPMSGFGERFRRAGYETPKPLIVVDGKPIIHHVIDLFPGDHDFIFICNEDHLQNQTFRMREILEETGVRHKIHSIPPHKLGPVHAVLSAKELLNPDLQTIVNYADFTCLWSFEDFALAVSQPNVQGAVPAYRGFHPHSGGTTNYAYIRETDGLLEEIREKQPFTDQKTEEFASTGTYFFRDARTMIHYLERQVAENTSVEGEFYVSSAFDLMAKDKKDVLVYEIHHFMQWGTPQDLAEYEFWSQKLADLSRLQNGALPIQGTGATLILASGLGSRFISRGYQTPKPLLKIGGKTILDQVSKVGEEKALCLISTLESASMGNVAKSNPLARQFSMQELSGGQADSASFLVDQLPFDFEGTLTVLPSDTLFADESGGISAAQETPGLEALTVWAQTPSTFNLQNPESFGWIGEDGDEVWSSVKAAPLHKNPMVMSGAFTFSSPDLFRRLYWGLYSSGSLVNGERYLDSMVQTAIEMGISVKVFTPSATLTLGTPYEFETYRYWQACFDLWSTHPYSLEKDIFIDRVDVPAVREELSTTLHEAEEWG